MIKYTAKKYGTSFFKKAIKSLAFSAPFVPVPEILLATYDDGNEVSLLEQERKSFIT